jgi:hypothetical protein
MQYEQGKPMCIPAENEPELILHSYLSKGRLRCVLVKVHTDLIGVAESDHKLYTIDYDNNTIDCLERTGKNMNSFYIPQKYTGLWIREDDCNGVPGGDISANNQ